MKKTIALVLALVMIFALAACGKSSSDSSIPSDVQKQADSIVSDLTGTGANVTGGWTKQDASALDDNAKAVFEAAVAGQDGQFTPLALEATQVVAGTNYLFLAQVVQNGTTTYRLLTVYADLQGNASVTDSQTLG